MTQPTAGTDAGTFESVPAPPPTAPGAILRQLGPGLIITASIVGSGELIMTTILGAEVGFILLWFIIFGCMIKVFVQIELGRYAIVHGRTTLQAMNDLPGWPSGWMVYIWLFMYVATFFQLAGIVGAIAGVLQLGGLALSDLICALLITGSCAILLAIGKYRVIEGVSTTMVALFTLFTIFAVGALQWTEYAITSQDILSGFQFRMPENFTIAFAAFGIIGVGASELIYYPYWCLEKGYARHVGPNDGTAEWQERADGWLRVMATDAWVSMFVYTGATLAFFALGAAVLHDREVAVNDKNLVPSLSQMYEASFGQFGLFAFLIGAFVVLYSTVFIATASNGRLMADVLTLFRITRPRNQQEHDRLVRLSCVLLPVLYFVIFVVVGGPLTLVLIGAVAQGLMLPLLCLAALYFHHKKSKRSVLWTVCLWVASLMMIVTGVYQLWVKAPALYSAALEQLQRLMP